MACFFRARRRKPSFAARQPIFSRSWPQPDIVSALGDVGMTTRSSTPQALSDLLKADTEEWRRLIKQIGFTAES